MLIDDTQLIGRELVMPERSCIRDFLLQLVPELKPLIGFQVPKQPRIGIAVLGTIGGKKQLSKAIS